VEKTISSKIIYQGKVIKVRVDEVLLVNGRISRREIVEHGGAVAILALNEKGEAYFVRQYRKPLEKELLEVPAGKLEEGEIPAECAVRELEEEIGLTPGKLSLLASFYSSPGFTSEKLFVYLATELRPVETEKPVDEIIQIISLPFDKALNMAKDGQFEDGKTLVALLLAENIV